MGSGSDRLVTISATAAERAEAAAWVNARIGLPWTADGEGPRGYNCWGFVRAALRDLADIDLPAAPIAELVAVLSRREVRRDWRPSDRLSHLAICVTGSTRRQHHVGLGLELDGGVIAHAVEGVGVIVSRPLELRAMGFADLRWLVHAPPEPAAPAMAA